MDTETRRPRVTIAGQDVSHFRPAPPPAHRGQSPHEATAQLRRAWHTYTEARARVHPTPTYDEVVATVGTDPLAVTA